ncbi:MAG: sulfite exporter TauE/SafE family protein [Gammaproteobacteria bacterium]|nr:sulfite exporter TauE/SafE family protein [Gammaproteobacteria bacterium]
MFIESFELSALQIIFSITVIFLAYILKGLSGFGSGLIAIPLLAFIFPITFIVPVLGLLNYSGTLMQSYHLRKQVVWNDILPLMPFTLAGIAIAIWLLVNVNEEILVRILGGFVICYSIYSLLPLPDFKGGRKWVVFGGGLGGMVGALFGTGGPFYVVYLKMRQLNKTQFRASIAMIFFFDGGVRIIGYALNGLYTPQVLWMLLMLLPVLFIGMYVGHHLHVKFDQKKFNQVISVLLMMSGLMLLYKSMV